MPRTIAHEPDIQARHAAALESLLDRLDQITASFSSTEILLRVSYEQGCHDTQEAILRGHRPRRPRPARTGAGPGLKLVEAESVRLILEASR